MALTSSGSDTDFNLLQKSAQNLYEYALAQGAVGLNPPSWNDTKDILLSKMAYYTAKISP